MSLQTEKSWCNGCCRQTNWEIHASKRVCAECRTSFPCKACGHLDCKEDRGEVACCPTCRWVGGHEPGCAKGVDTGTDTPVESPT